jgi:hypothetical protein
MTKQINVSLMLEWRCEKASLDYASLLTLLAPVAE